MRLLVAVSAVLALIACGPPTANEEDVPSSCSQLRTALGYADECRPELCLPAEPIEIVAGSDGDPALSCSSCLESALQSYRYDDEQLDLYLSFRDDVRGNYSSESFSAAFSGGTVRLQLDIGQGENTNKTIYLPDDLGFASPAGG